MNRPGEMREFREGDNVIRAVPIVAVEGYSDPTPNDGIDNIVVSFSSGTIAGVERLNRTIADRYVGSLYSTWLRGIAAPADPPATVLRSATYLWR